MRAFMAVLLSDRFQFERFSQCTRSREWPPSGSIRVDLIRSLPAMGKSRDASIQAGVIGSAGVSAGGGRRDGLVGRLTSRRGIRPAAERAALAGEACADRRISQRPD